MHRTLPISEHLYTALLGLYPPTFRAAYGHQMRLTFRDACHDAYGRNGAGGLLVLWLPTLFDLLKSALEEQARQGEFIMLKGPWTASAGPLTIIIGVLMWGGPVGDLVWLVRPSEDLWEFFHFDLLLVCFGLMLPAFITILLRYQEDAGGLGRLGLILSVAGSAGMFSVISASFLLSIRQPDPLQYWLTFTAVICGLSILVGHVLFGINTLRFKLLPRWNALPLLVGLTAPLLTVLSMITENTSGIDHYQLELTIVPLQSSITGVWWILMGVAMMSQRPEQEVTATA